MQNSPKITGKRGNVLLLKSCQDEKQFVPLWIKTSSTKWMEQRQEPNNSNSALVQQPLFQNFKAVPSLGDLPLTVLCLHWTHQPK